MNPICLPHGSSATPCHLLVALKACYPMSGRLGWAWRKTAWGSAVSENSWSSEGIRRQSLGLHPTLNSWTTGGSSTETTGPLWVSTRMWSHLPTPSLGCAAAGSPILAHIVGAGASQLMDPGPQVLGREP